MKSWRESPAVSTPRSPSAVTESHISSMGAKPQPSTSKAFPGRGEISKKVSSPLISSKSLWATRSPVLVVNRIFDSQGVFIREKGDVGLGLWQVVEHPSVSNTLAMGSDRSRGKIWDQTLAVAFVQTAMTPAATTVVWRAGAWMEDKMRERERKKGWNEGRNNKRIADKIWGSGRYSELERYYINQS